MKISEVQISQGLSKNVYLINSLRIPSFSATATECEQYIVVESLRLLAFLQYLLMNLKGITLFLPQWMHVPYYSSLERKEPKDSQIDVTRGDGSVLK